MDPSNTNGNRRKLKMFFFPYIAGGHLLPMIDTARFFASHPDVQVTIIATPKNVQLFQKAIDRDREEGHDIGFQTVMLPTSESGLPEGFENFMDSGSIELRLKLFMATMKLREPLLDILHACRPHCLISDMLHPWSLDVANEVGIPRIAFNVSCLFNTCAEYSLRRFKPQESVRSDTEPFDLPGLPDKVQFTRSRIPDWHRVQNEVTSYLSTLQQAEEKSYGVIFNSFYDLESKYAEHCKYVMGRKLWVVGPVSQYSNRNIIDKVQRGAQNVQNNDDTLNWLDSQKPNSVLYVSFGSDANISKEQFHEIAHGLEASRHAFIWVAKSNFYQDQGEEGWFPVGFEERIAKLNQGMVIKGWAPQLVILGHANVGAFMTHCGWNSSIEGLSNGLPMITWPLGVDQFFNESLLVDVLKVGFRVGNEEWMSIVAEPKATVTRDRVETAVRRMMDYGEEVVEMKLRVKNYYEKAKIAVEEGGTSHQDVYALVQELRGRHPEFVTAP